MGLRVVLDTNVLVSALLKPGGLEARLVQSAMSGTLTMCVSREVMAEYREVFGRAKFASIAERGRELLQHVERSAFGVQPAALLAVAPDEEDNRFLECAEAAGATYLVTGNLRHYPGSYGATRIVNARGFFESVD